MPQPSWSSDEEEALVSFLLLYSSSHSWTFRRTDVSVGTNPSLVQYQKGLLASLLQDGWTDTLSEEVYFLIVCTVILYQTAQVLPDLHTLYMYVLCCFALFVCLTLLASFFLPSHLSFKNMYMYNVYVHVESKGAL